MVDLKNSFALLDNEDSDDLAVLVVHVAKKVDKSSMHAEIESHSSKPEKDDENGNDGNNDARGGNHGGERIGHRNRVRNEGAADGQKRVRDYDSGSGQDDWESSKSDRYRDKRRVCRNGCRSNGRGRRFGVYMRKCRDADGTKRFKDDDGGGWGGSGYQVEDYDAGSEQHDVNRQSRDGNRFTGNKERAYVNGNRNNGRVRRGYGGYRGKGGHGYHGSGSEEVSETDDAVDGHDVNGSEGDGVVVVEVLKAAETEEKNTSEDISGGSRDPKEEDKEATFMTLDEYEKLLAKKRQALESLNREKRPVVRDGKNSDGTDDIEKSEGKRKKKKKKKKKGSWAKKEEGLKPAILEAHKHLLNSASCQRSFDGRSGGRGGRWCGEHVSFTGPNKFNHNPLIYRHALQRQRAPTNQDFPVLGSNPLAAAAAAAALPAAVAAAALPAAAASPTPTPASPPSAALLPLPAAAASPTPTPGSPPSAATSPTPTPAAPAKAESD